MLDRLIAIPDFVFFAASAVSAIFVGAGWLVAQAAPPTPMVSGGTLFAGLVAVITAMSPLILGAMDRKKLRATLAVTVADRDAKAAEVKRLRKFVVEQAAEQKIKLPPWFFDSVAEVPPPVRTGEHELIRPPKGEDQ